MGWLSAKIGWLGTAVAGMLDCQEAAVVAEAEE
jgi:hypothetical protein